MNSLKPGRTSSEFWLKVLLVVVFILNGTEHVNIPWEQMPFLVAAIGLYSWERYKVKEAVINAAPSAASTGEQRAQ